MSLRLQQPCRPPEPPCKLPGPLAVFSVWSLLGMALKWRPAYPAASSSREVPTAGCGGSELAVAAKAAESLRGLRKVMGPFVERAEASVRTVAGREGRLDAVWAPAVEDEGSGVTGGGPGAPGEAGGREEAPGGIEGPGEGRGGWEALGSPGNLPPGPKGNEGEAWAPEGLTGKVCMLDRLVLKRSWSSWSAGL